jgi:hypothetical protein
MSKLAVIVPALLAAGCAVHQSEIAADASPAAPNARPELIATTDDSVTATVTLPESTDTETIEIDEIDNGLICESRSSTGTRINRNVCYTREEHAAIQAQMQEQAKRDLANLEREQRVLAMRQQEIEEQRRRALVR